MGECSLEGERRTTSADHDQLLTTMISNVSESAGRAPAASLDLSWDSGVLLTAGVLGSPGPVAGWWRVDSPAVASGGRVRKSLGRWDKTLRLGGGPGGGAEAVECFGQLVCPGPVGVEPEVPAAGGADENRGGVCSIW